MFDMLRLLGVGAMFLSVALPFGVADAQPVGAVDTSFGATAGFSYFDGVNTPDVRGSITSLVALPDRGVLAGGTCLLPPAYTQIWACIYRWRPATSNAWPDATFGAGGVSYVLPNTTSPLIALRPDGRIWVAGSCTSGALSVWCTAVVSANGVGFDATYGINGQTQISLPAGYGAMSLQDIALQPDGKLVLAGSCQNIITPLNRSYCITRLTAGGELDAGFGSNGWVTTFPGPGDSLQRMRLLSDGGILVSGTCGATFTTTFVCTLRYSANGSYVGTVTTQWGTDRAEFVYDILLRDGKVTVVGDGTDALADSRLFASRYDLLGTPDASFGGTFPTNGTGANTNIQPSNPGYARAAKILRDGAILYIGACGNGTSLCSARLTANGVLDSAFGIAGRFAYAAPHSPFATGIAQLTTVEQTVDGSVLAGGFCNSLSIDRPCLRRYLGGPDTTKVCTMDIDGDGIVNATTDGLLLTRISLGIGGNAALAGALGAGATRTTWTQVRDYLFNECNMPVAP